MAKRAVPEQSLPIRRGEPPSIPRKPATVIG
jgi:hypothetical protein